jgi:hypothetical protein
MGLLGKQGGVLCAFAGVEVAWIELLLMLVELVVETSLSGLSEHSKQSSSSMRWRSGSRSVKANPINGEDHERGLMLTVNVLVEL